MEAIEKNLRARKRLDWFFIVMGLIELFMLVLFTSSYFGLTASLFGVLFGLITIVPAYIALTEKNYNWNYFVSIWTIIKYNPITWIAMVAFILGDFFRASQSSAHVHRAVGWDTLLPIAIAICFLLLVLASFVFGILLIVNTMKYSKLKKQKEISNLIETRISN
jgi:hypothetical protein